MPAATIPTTALFSGLVLIVLVLVIALLRRVPISAAAISALVVVYLILPALLASLGALDRYDPLPAPALILLLGLSGLTAYLTLSRAGSGLPASIPLAAVGVLQAFRVGVEWLLHRLYLEGGVPIQMTYAGRNWDILSGLTGLALGIWLFSGRSVPRWLILGWNVVGLTLLANIVAIAVVSTPVPFRQFMEGPANLLPSTFPFVWLPSFLVEVALGSHLLVFRHLRSGSPNAR